MTRDEVRELIARTLTDCDKSLGTWTYDDHAEAVLAAFAARGIVIGEKQSKHDVPEQLGFDRERIEELAQFSLALVRVVPND